MTDRGMCKWLPYKSLVEQLPILERILYEKNKKPKPTLSNEKANEINEVLTNYCGEQVKLVYWEDGYIYTILGHLTKIDATYKRLAINGEYHSFKEILNLERT